MNDRVRVALIYGSTRNGRFCDKVAAWAAQEIAGRGEFSVDIIDPLDTSRRQGTSMSCHLCRSESRRPMPSWWSLRNITMGIRRHLRR